MKIIKNKKQYNAALQRFEEIFHTKNDNQEAKVLAKSIKKYEDKHYKISTSDLMPDEVKKGIEKGIEESKKGMGRSHEEVMKDIVLILKTNLKGIKRL